MTGKLSLCQFTVQFEDSQKISIEAATFDGARRKAEARYGRQNKIEYIEKERNPMTERHVQLADAYELVATANHYMVGIVEPFTDDELIDAYAILINRQNTHQEGCKAWKQLGLALDLAEHDSRIRRLS